VQNRGEILKKTREEAERRRAEAQAMRANSSLNVPAGTRPPLVDAGGCPVKSGADIGAALSAKPDLVTMKLKLPRRS
jgi:hypothetical protein